MKCSRLDSSCEDLGGGVEREEQALRAGMHDVAVVGVGRCDGAVGLGRGVLDRRHLVALLEHVIGGAERRLDIAEAQLLMVVFVVILEIVSRIGLVDDDRARLQRLLHVEHRGQRIIADANQFDGGHGFRLAVGDDGDDRLALVAHLVDGERRLVVLAESDQAEQRVLVERHVLPPHHALDARRALGGGDVDAPDPGVMMRRAHHLQMQQAVKAVIVEEAGAAGDMPQHVLALLALADHVEIVVALVGEQILAKFQHRDLLRRGGRRAAARRPEWR